MASDEALKMSWEERYLELEDALLNLVCEDLIWYAKKGRERTENLNFALAMLEKHAWTPGAIEWHLGIDEIVVGRTH